VRFTENYAHHSNKIIQFSFNNNSNVVYITLLCGKKKLHDMHTVLAPFLNKITFYTKMITTQLHVMVMYSYANSFQQRIFEKKMKSIHQNYVLTSHDNLYSEKSFYQRC